MYIFKLANRFSKILIVDNENYDYWRFRILFSSIIGYATFYLVRQNFSIAMLEIEKEFGYSKVDLGWILTVFSIVYGMGRLINGYLSDCSSARVFITLGLLGSAGINILMGCSSSILLFGLFWGLNGWFQSMGWPPCARLLTYWFSPRERGTKWSIWSSSHQIGSMSIIVLASFLIERLGWRYAFFIPSIITFLIALFLFNQLRDSPSELGFSTVEIYKDELTQELDEPNKKLILKETLILIFKNKSVWYISIANIFLYTLRMGIVNWAPTFLREYKGLSLFFSGSQLIIFEISGLIGGVTVGWISDKFFNGQHSIVAMIYLLLLFIFVLMLWKVPTDYFVLNSISLLFSGFLISGPQVLMGIALANYTSKQTIGLVTGFAGVMGYVVGAAIAGAGIGKIVDLYGWQGGFLIFLGSALCSAFCFFLAWNNYAKK